MSKLNIVYGSKIKTENNWDILPIKDGLTYAKQIINQNNESEGYEIAVQINENNFYYCGYLSMYSDDTLTFDEKLNNRYHTRFLELLNGESVEKFLFNDFKTHLESIFNDTCQNYSLYPYGGIIQFFNIAENNELSESYKMALEKIKLLKLNVEKEIAQKEIKKQELAQEKYNKELNEALEKLKNSNDLPEKDVILLCKHFDLWNLIPIKTRGWINANLVTLKKDGARFYGKLNINSPVWNIYDNLQEAQNKQ